MPVYPRKFRFTKVSIRSSDDIKVMDVMPVEARPTQSKPPMVQLMVTNSTQTAWRMDRETWEDLKHAVDMAFRVNEEEAPGHAGSEPGSTPGRVMHA